MCSPAAIIQTTGSLATTMKLHNSSDAFVVVVVDAAALVVAIFVAVAVVLSLAGWLRKPFSEASAAGRQQQVAADQGFSTFRVMESVICKRRKKEIAE